ncbi:P-loop containing nucleoside triphosphate hydrolase protein [Parathielavia appendiculata]|uniref:Thymidylate kinase n=1 Tax=Parathielavia appendiculata TaxID=2587402 RepID=A0AAN6TUH1_9PEZI|nr:P-loop containing nucleoside triphosphate hydrolase protein [Parathielavia appendiculata]
MHAREINRRVPSHRDSPAPPPGDAACGQLASLNGNEPYFLSLFQVMASINDLATAATALATSSAAAAPHQPPVPDPAPHTDDRGGSTGMEQPAVARGALVVLEGLDRSGKTTQVKLLEQRFVELGRKVKVMRFPGMLHFKNLTYYRTTPIGQMIDSYLKSQVDMDDHVIHLLFSANRWEAAKSIASLLSAGTTVLCDRYYHSGIVYSAAKQNPSLTLSWARAPEVGLPRPDLVLFLDLDESAAQARGGWGGEAYERADMQRRVRELFWGLSLGKIETASVIAAEDDAAGPREEVAVGPPTTSQPRLSGVEYRFRQEEEDLHVIDASPSVEEVAEEVWKVVKARVEAVGNGEVGRTVRRVS